MKISGRRLLNQLLSWDFNDRKIGPQRRVKNWSKKLRYVLKCKLKKELSSEDIDITKIK